MAYNPRKQMEEKAALVAYKIAKMVEDCREYPQEESNELYQLILLEKIQYQVKRIRTKPKFKNIALKYKKS